MIDHIGTDLGRLNGLRHRFRDWQLRVVGDLFKVVVLAAGFLFTVLIGVERCRAFRLCVPLGQHLCRLAFRHGFCVGLRVGEVVGLQRFRQGCRRLGRLLPRLLALPLPLFSCETFADDGVQFFLREGFGRIRRRRFRR